MSPGTSASLSSVRSSPSRIAEARGAVIPESASIAFCARISCTNPIAAFSSTTARITAMSTYSSKNQVTAAATSRM